MAFLNTSVRARSCQPTLVTAPRPRTGDWWPQWVSSAPGSDAVHPSPRHIGCSKYPQRARRACGDTHSRGGKTAGLAPAICYPAQPVCVLRFGFVLRSHPLDVLHHPPFTHRAAEPNNHIVWWPKWLCCVLRLCQTKPSICCEQALEHRAVSRLPVTNSSITWKF